MKKKRPNKNHIDFRNTTKPQHKPRVHRPTVPIEGMRLNKYIAHCGICSRRQAADLVKAGKIQVNGAVQLEPWYQMQADDRVTYQGKHLQPETQHVYILMNKPKNTITTVSDERGRKTVMDVIGDKVTERIFPVGRLDRATVGLLLLTNDGGLAQKLAHPSYTVQKVYQVRLDKEVDEAHLQAIRTGITLEDGFVPVDKAHYVQGTRQEVMVEIHIGRNRIVRRIFEHFGYEVVKLDRTYYAGLTKKDLPRGQFRHLTEREVIMLKHFT
ncbi:MAG: pseudouridine synthase [Bacteroidota bacterium]